MKKQNRILLMCLCGVLVIGAAVAGTLAWLADEDAVVNTFTVGQVQIKLDETKVNPDGTVVSDAERVKANTYHMIPGQTYVKDPVLTVLKDSEECYVRLMLTLNCKRQLDTIFDPGVELTSIFNGWDANTWQFYEETADESANTVIYEFRYKTAVKPDGADLPLDALFDSFTVPSQLDGDDLKSIQDLTITVEGHAIQAAGFADADAAWAAFARQYAE